MVSDGSLCYFKSTRIAVTRLLRELRIFEAAVNRSHVVLELGAKPGPVLEFIQSVAQQLNDERQEKRVVRRAEDEAEQHGQNGVENCHEVQIEAERASEREERELSPRVLLQSVLEASIEEIDLLVGTNRGQP